MLLEEYNNALRFMRHAFGRKSFIDARSSPSTGTRTAIASTLTMQGSAVTTPTAMMTSPTSTQAASRRGTTTMSRKANMAVGSAKQRRRLHHAT